MNKLEKYWILLGVTSLGLSGIFTILLIIGRTSNLLKSVLAEEFFTDSLAIHVNLGILVWLVATTISYFASERTAYWLPLLAAAFGTVMITVSPFIGHGNAYTNNYIPVFDTDIFKTGLMLFLAAAAFESITALFSHASFRLKSVALLLIFSFAAFALSYYETPDKTSSHALFETTFWGGGHILQFAYAQIMMVAWLLLSEKSFKRFFTGDSTLKIIFILPIIFVALTSLYIYSSLPPESPIFIHLFDKQMIYGNGIGPILIGFLILFGSTRGFKFDLAFFCLFFSMLLFLIGGALGQLAAKAMQRGEITTIIPAHYHFAIIGVTIALMGYIYSKLELPSEKTAIWQITLYTIGQTIYFAGFAVLGGHGAARKTPGLDMINMSEHSRKMVAHVMDSGGSLSLIGGIMFVVIVYRNLKLSRY